MNLLDFVQIIVVVLLIIIPPLLMAWLVRIRPIYQLVQRSRFNRIMIVLGDGLLYFLISYGTLLWLIAVLFFGLSEIGVPAGISPESVVTEIWLRMFVPGGASCFSGNSAVCRVADKAFAMGVFAGNNIFVLIVVLISTFVALLLSWRFTVPRAEKSNSVQNH